MNANEKNLRPIIRLVHLIIFMSMLAIGNDRAAFLMAVFMFASFFEEILDHLRGEL